MVCARETEALMQIGFMLLVVAIVIGAASAILEITRPKAAWCFMVLCGLVVWAAAYDIGLHPEGIARVYGAATANVSIWFLWLAGLVIELMCLLWLAKCLVGLLRR